ncbi:SRPBCC domain-containing protein [Streptomyces sp. SBR177]
MDSRHGGDRGSAAFVYTTYIRTTPEELWKALTEPGLTRRYWGVAFETDWAVGSTMVWDEGGRTTADPEQVVLISEPGRMLSYTWHTFTPSGPGPSASARRPTPGSSTRGAPGSRTPSNRPGTW